MGVCGCGVGNSEVTIERLNSTGVAILANITMGVGPTRWGVVEVYEWGVENSEGPIDLI